MNRELQKTLKKKILTKRDKQLKVRQFASAYTDMVWAHCINYRNRDGTGRDEGGDLCGQGCG